MITDHTAVQKSVFDLGASCTGQPPRAKPARRLGNRPQKRQLAFGPSAVQVRSGLCGARKWFIASGHRCSQDGPDPQRAERDLKAALEGTAPMFQGHLEHAEEVQAAIGKQTSVSSGK